MTDTAFIERTFTSHDGLTLYCREYGAEHAGTATPTVLCLAGLTRNSRDFHNLATALAVTHRVLALDMRGRGRSAYDLNPANYQPQTYATDVMTLAAALQAPKLFIVGTSLGGLVAMVLAMFAPALLAGVVLNDIGPEIDPTGLQRIASYAGKLPPVTTWDEAARQAAIVHRAAMPTFTADDWMHFARCTYRDDGHGHPVPDMDPRIGDTMRATPTPAIDLWPLFAALGPLPALVIRGALSDLLSTATVQRMQQMKPDLRTLTVPQRGHAPTLDEPECRSAILELLQNAR